MFFIIYVGEESFEQFSISVILFFENFLLKEVNFENCCGILEEIIIKVCENGLGFYYGFNCEQ